MSSLYLIHRPKNLHPRQNQDFGSKNLDKTMQEARNKIKILKSKSPYISRPDIRSQDCITVSL